MSRWSDYGLEFPELSRKVKVVVYCACSNRVTGYTKTDKTSSRSRCLNILLRVSALHYSARSRELEGFWTVASARVLHQPTIVGPSISIINVHKFGTNWN